MDTATLEKIKDLLESVQLHTEEVELRMAKAGMAPNRAVAEGVAKYWDAFERLAAE